MAVKIRLARQGAKKRPQFMVVVMDRESRRDGAYLERLGYYYPEKKDPKEKLKVNLERVAAWQARGATVSQTVGQLLQITSK